MFRDGADRSARCRPAGASGIGTRADTKSFTTAKSSHHATLVQTPSAPDSRHGHRNAVVQRTGPMLRITPTLADDECLLKLEGCLTGDWVPVLGACWGRMATAAPDRRVRVDLTDVCRV